MTADLILMNRHHQKKQNLKVKDHSVKTLSDLKMTEMMTRTLQHPLILLKALILQRVKERKMEKTKSERLAFGKTSTTDFALKPRVLNISYLTCPRIRFAKHAYRAR